MLMRLINYITLLLCLALMSTCKKYPENTLWFQNVEKINFFDRFKITSYTVNSLDSINSFSKYYCSKVKNKDVTQLQFIDDHQNGNSLYTTLDGYKTHFYYSYSKNKSKLYIYSLTNLIDTNIMKKNIFIFYPLWWEIIKLDINGERKIKTVYENNSYEITFNPGT